MKYNTGDRAREIIKKAEKENQTTLNLIGEDEDILPIVLRNMPKCVEALRFSPPDAFWLDCEFWILKPASRHLKALEIYDPRGDWVTKDGILYSDGGLKLFLCPEGRSGTVKVAEGTESIGGYAFQSIKLDSVKFPNTLRKIWLGAFAGCGLKKIVLPASVQEVGRFNFLSAEEITMEGAKPPKGALAAAIAVDGAELSDADHTAKPYIIVSLGGQKFAVPRFTAGSQIKRFLKNWDEGTVDMGEAGALFKTAEFGEDAQDTALAELLLNKGNQKAKRYVKKYASGMAGRYMAKADTESLARLTGTGLVGRDTLEGLLADAQEAGNDMAVGYLLDAIGKCGRKKKPAKL